MKYYEQNWIDRIDSDLHLRRLVEERRSKIERKIGVPCGIFVGRRTTGEILYDDNGIAIRVNRHIDEPANVLMTLVSHAMSEDEARVAMQNLKAD